MSQNFKTILITGSSGFLGSNLLAKLTLKPCEITILTRQKPAKLAKSFSFGQAILKFCSSFDEINSDFDLVINLAGEPIAQRWTNLAKEKIIESRISLTKKLVAKIKQQKTPPKLFLSASAIGFYGTSENLIFDENSTTNSPDYFSAQLCKDWEEAAMEANRSVDRLVLLRTGVVLDASGGFLKKMLLPFMLGLGGKIGSGKQFLSWIALQDWLRAVEFIIENKEIVGAVNFTSPNAVSNAEFSRLLAKSLHRPCFCKVPDFAMSLIYGQMAKELILEGQKVVPAKLIAAGFKFEFENLAEVFSKNFR